MSRASKARRRAARVTDRPAPKTAARSTRLPGRVPPPPRPRAAAVRRRRVEQEQQILPLGALDRRDASWAAATALLASVLFATALRGYPALGDAPETVAAVKAFGILHAPGYPSYLLAVKAFTLLEPFGSLALRVNLFSLVSAAAYVAGVFLLGRRLHVERWASAFGALTVAAGGGFWFHATFAKHIMFSGLTVVVALHLLLAWWERPSTRRLLALAVAVAVGMGSSWPLMILFVPVVGVILVLSIDRVRLLPLLAAGLTAVVLTAAFYGFLMVRASQRPAVNWGEATTLPALKSLLTRGDFTGRAVYKNPRGHRVPGNIELSHSTGATKQAESIGRYFKMIGREVGLVAVLLAVWGLVASVLRPWRRATIPLALTFVANLIGASITIPAKPLVGYNTNLIHFGFMAALWAVVGAWVALGASDLVGRLLRWRRVSSRPQLLGRLRIAAPAVLVLAALVPALIMHWPVAHRGSRPLADRYAESIFRELPRNAVVFIFGSEKTQALRYEQLVKGQRQDVTVVAIDGLAYRWYRNQIARHLGVRFPPPVGDTVKAAKSAIQVVRRVRPVRLDAPAAQVLKTAYGYRQAGLLAVLAPGHGAQPINAPAMLEGRVVDAERRAGIPGAPYGVWPNQAAASTYVAAMFEVARAYYSVANYDGMRRSFLNVLSVTPDDRQAREGLDTLDSGGSFSSGSG